MSDSEVSTTAKRIKGVWDLYGARSGQSSTGDRIYALYLFGLFSVLYLAPIVYATAQLPPLISFSGIGSTGSTPPVEASIAILLVTMTGLCLTSLFFGRLWGPAVLRPFILHVFTATDLPPHGYLIPVARRHIWWATCTLLVGVSAAIYMFTDLFTNLGFASLGLGISVGLSILAPALWLQGQARSVKSNLKIAGGIGCIAIVAGLAWLGLAKQVQSGTAWSPVTSLFPDATLTQSTLTLSALVLITTTVLVAGLFFRSRGLADLEQIDLDQLQTDSARAASAQVFTTTGSFHHAFDLFQPEPKGHTSALIRRPDGANAHLRGHLTQGLIRALRTPTRLITAGVFLALGAVALSANLGGLFGTGQVTIWFLGALCLYLGFGKVTGTWKSLLAELSLAPLFGPGRFGLFLRNLVWPAAIVALVAVIGSTLTLVATVLSGTSPVAADGPIQTIGYFLATCALAFGTRFLREMKLEIPAKLLYPITTPLGDISGLRVVMWQFDGILALAIGVALMQAAPSFLVAAGVSLCVCAYSLWTGLRQARS